MFGLFKNKCPLTPFEQTTVERYVYLLMKSLGTERILKTKTITPTSEFFREPYEPNLKGVRLLMQRIADHLNVDASQFEIQIVTRPEVPGAIITEEQVGEKTRLYLLKSMLTYRDHIVALLASEVCKYIISIPETQRLYENDPEVFGNFASLVLGFGVFAINSYFEIIDEWVDSDGHTGSTPAHVGSIQVGFLDAKIAGYTLAILSYIRQEEMPRWVEHLRHEEARNHFWRSLKYLQKTNDCLIQPNSSAIVDEPAQELISQILTGSVQQRLRAIWKIDDRFLYNPEVIEALCKCVKDREEIVAEVACDILGSFGEVAASAIPTLLEALCSRRKRVRVSAVVALGMIGQQPEKILPILREMLFEIHEKATSLHISFRLWDRASVAVLVAHSIGLFGSDAKELLPDILNLFYEVVFEATADELNYLVGAVYSLVSDPHTQVLAHFRDGNDQKIARMLECLGKYEPPEEESSDEKS